MPTSTLGTLIRLARESCIRIEVDGRLTPTSKIESAMAGALVDGAKKGDSRLITEAQKELRAWIDQYVGNAWGVYKERLVAAELNHSRNAVETSRTSLDDHLTRVKDNWVTDILHSSLVTDRDLGEDFFHREVDRAIKLALKTVDADFRSLRDAAILKDAASAIREPKASNRVVIVYGRDPSASACSKAVVEAAGLLPYDFDTAKADIGLLSFSHEIIDQLFRHASSAVVVISPDERAELKAALRTDRDKGLVLERDQPRPNVLFEYGLALGLFQRQVVVLEFGNCPQPSDLDGIHPIRWKNFQSTGTEVFECFKMMGLPVTESFCLDHAIEYRPPEEVKQEFPFEDVDASELPFLQMTTNAISQQDLYSKYTEAGYKLSLANEHQLADKELTGGSQVVWQNSHGKLFQIGLRAADSRMIWIKRKVES